VLSVFDPDCEPWEQDCIYQPWLLAHQGRYFDFYNAAKGSREQTGAGIFVRSAELDALPG
jgi:hypothetical protein